MPPIQGIRGHEQQQQESAHVAAVVEDDAASNGSSDYNEPQGAKEHIEHRWRKIMSWINKNRVLFDFLAYFFFIVVFTYVATAANPGSDLIEQNRAVKTAIGLQEFWPNASQTGKNFYDIDTVADFWNFLTPFANVVLSNSFPDQPGFFYRYFRILGLVRLRQVRVQKNSCKIPKELSSYVNDCYAPFSNEVMDAEPYGPTDPETKLPIWKWRSAQEMMEGTYTGRSGISYPGSGFNITLPLDYSDALQKLYFLKDNKWIDLQTRAVFIDFLVYNANVRLLTLIKVAVEFPASSGCRPYLLLRTSQIDRLVAAEMSSTSMLAEFILVVLTSIYVFVEVKNFWRLRWKYFDDKWVYIEIVNYVLFFAAFAMRFQPFYFVYANGFPPRPDAFVNFETPMWAIIQWKNIMSLNSVITWMRLFKYLRSVPFMQLLIQTVSLAMGQVVSFMCIFMIIICGFTLSNLLAFGGELDAYRSYEFTLYSLYRSLIGYDLFDQMYDTNRVLGPLLYSLWTLIGFFLLLNMFVAILNDAIMEAKEGIPKISFGNFAKGLAHQWIEAIRKRYAKFVEDEEEAEARKAKNALKSLPAFNANIVEVGKEDPLWALTQLKQQQAEKLKLHLVVKVDGRPETAPDEDEHLMGSLLMYEDDEERLNALEHRLGKLVRGMKRLAPERAQKSEVEHSSFGNPYGHNSLRKSM